MKKRTQPTIEDTLAGVVAWARVAANMPRDPGSKMNAVLNHLSEAIGDYEKRSKGKEITPVIWPHER